MTVAILVVQGNTTDLKADTAGVRLEAVLLQVPKGTTEVARSDERAVLYSMPLVLAPEAFIAQLVRRPVPWAVDRLLDVTNVSRVKRRGGWGEGMGDVAAEVTIAICPGETAH